MNLSPSSPALYWLLIFVFVLGCVPLLASNISAAEPTFGASLQANVVLDFASNRTRMVQISMVIVALGCALMYWYK